MVQSSRVYMVLIVIDSVGNHNDVSNTNDTQGRNQAEAEGAAASSYFGAGKPKF